MIDGMSLSILILAFNQFLAIVSISLNFLQNLELNHNTGANELNHT